MPWPSEGEDLGERESAQERERECVCVCVRLREKERERVMGRTKRESSESFGQVQT